MGEGRLTPLPQGAGPGGGELSGTCLGWGVCRAAPLGMKEGGNSWGKSRGDTQHRVFMIDWDGRNPGDGGESRSPSREATWSLLPPAPATRGKQTPSQARPPRCWGVGQRPRLGASFPLSHWRPRHPGAHLLFHRPKARTYGRGLATGGSMA